MISAYTLGAVITPVWAGTKVDGRGRVDAELLCTLGVVLDLAGVVLSVLLVTVAGLALELDTLGVALGFGSGLLLSVLAVGNGRLLIALVGQGLGTFLLGLLSVVVVGFGVGSAWPEVEAGGECDGDSTEGPMRG